MPLTPDEAREILENFDAAEEREDRETVWMQTEFQMALIKGPWAAAIGKLHDEIIRLQHSQDTTQAERLAEAQAEHDALCEKLAAEIEERMRTEGIPDHFQLR